jgi:hypothetical protein
MSVPEPVAPLSPPPPTPPEVPPVAVLPVTHCPSCGEEVRGRYCSTCGQSLADVRVPFGKWLRDYIEDTFHVDSRMARSMGLLLTRPGALTLAYVEGQRSNYVRPFRLYLSASFLYFLVLSLVPAGTVVDVRSTRDASGEARVGLSVEVTRDARGVEPEAAPEAAPPPPRLKEDSEFKRRLNRFVESGPELARERVLHSIASTLPKAMFVLVPVFALLLRLLYRKSGRFYAEHFLFTLHFHAFAFLALAFGLVLTTLLGLGRLPVMQFFIMGYLFLALRRVHDEPRGRTAAKTAALYFGYGFLLLLTVTGAVMATIYLT